VESYVELARREGGTIRCGGRRPTLPSPFDKGYFYEPTIVTGISFNHQSSIYFPFSACTFPHEVLHRFTSY
jgi:acyl-CoA reductase-like NAD-dependent aldehyde dehydrogenase